MKVLVAMDKNLMVLFQAIKQSDMKRLSKLKVIVLPFNGRHELMDSVFYGNLGVNIELRLTMLT